MSPLAAIAKFFYSKNHQRAESHRSRLRRAYKRRRGFSLEPLEQRLLMSGDPLVFAAGEVASDVTVRVDDSATPLVQIVDNQTNIVILSQALADTSEVVVIGSEHDDTLTVDYSNGFFLPVSFHGGDGAGFDSLVITGGNFDRTAYKTLGPDSGTIALTAGAASAMITYSGLEPITDDTGGEKTFEGTDDTEDPDVITLSDSGSANDNSITIQISTGEDVTYTNASAITSLTINADDGDDEIFVNTLDTLFQGSVTINADAGDDEITINAKSSIGIYTIDGGDDTEYGDSIIVTPMPILP